MAPLVHDFVISVLDFSIAAWRDHGHSTAFIEFFSQPIGIEGLVGQKGIKADPFDKRLHADDVIALTRLQNKAHQITQSINKGNNFAR